MKKKLLYIGTLAVLSTGVYFLVAHQNPQYVSDLGFSFSYPTGMFVMTDPDSPRIYVIPNSYKANKNEPLTAIVISTSPNEPPMTPFEWLDGPNSGADMSKTYSKRDIDGQDAVSLEGGTWAVVNTPDETQQLSIATLPSGDTDQSLLTGMDTIVNSLVFTK
jgi:hypothetical protein